MTTFGWCELHHLAEAVRTSTRTESFDAAGMVTAIKNELIDMRKKKRYNIMMLMAPLKCRIRYVFYGSHDSGALGKCRIRYATGPSGTGQRHEGLLLLSTTWHILRSPRQCAAEVTIRSSAR